MKKYLKWVLCLVCLIILFLIIFLILRENNLAFDTAIYNYIIKYKSDFMSNFFKVVTFFASVLFMVFITLGCLFLPICKKYKIVIALNMINDVILNNVIKVIVKRERPISWFLVEESGYSFPSGHAMAAVCFYGLIIYLLYRSNIKKKYKIVIITFLTILILLIALSRIYLGVHYASDVIGGVVIALIYLVIYVTIIDRKILNKNNI